MGDARVIRFLCLKCDKEVKGSVFRSDMVTCNCGNIHIDNPDQLTIKDWDLVKVRHKKKWRNINEL
tara:strand:+ start:456 stop:653 length:198 start_codon:yes stop_codon:yes gene_type:complete